MKQVKKLVLPRILEEINNGLSPNDIAKKYNIPKTTIAYSVEKLKKMKCLEKEGHGVSSVWKVLKVVPIRPKDTLEVKTGLLEIRGHAFIWNIEFLEGGFDWKQVVENYKRRYKKPTLSFKMICRGKVPRTIFKNRKIWLTKTGLTIYEPLDFFGKSSFTVKGTAVFEMDKLVKELLEKLKLSLQKYRFKCSREHFAHINNQIARQFNDRKQKIKVEFDGKWFWIDYSDMVHEEETNDPNVSVQAQKYYKSQLKTNFEVTPEVIASGFKESAKQIEGNAKNFKKYAENIESHIGAIKKLGTGVETQNKLFEKLAKLIESKL